MYKGKEKEQLWQEREREREAIKADRTENGRIRIRFFGGNLVILLSESDYDRIADFYEKSIRLKIKQINFVEKIEEIEKSRPGSLVSDIFFWKAREWNEKNAEVSLLWREILRYERKHLKCLEEIEKRVDFSKIEKFQKLKAEKLEWLSEREKENKKKLEDYKKSGLIGDFEADGNVKKIIKNFLNKEKFESRAEVKPLLDQIREGMGAPVNRWLLGKIWANPITQLFLILGIIVGLLKVLWRQFVKENN